MSLPLPVIDRLFDRLALTYGSEWSRKWVDVDAVAVKSLWAHELSTFSENLKAIAWAIQNLGTKCPNAIEFKLLCKQAPRPQAPLLDSPKAPPEIVDTELAKIAEKTFTPAHENNPTRDYKVWAKKLKARHDEGEKLLTCQIRSYRQALEINQA